MTERAKRAVAMLQNLGWDCRDDGDKSCRQCSASVSRQWNYCPNCGAGAHAVPPQAAVDDLEAAVAAALGEPWRWAVREVGEGGIWQAGITLEDALSAAARWEEDGIDPVEVVPLFAGPAVQR
jgi:predicted amidophosphoribosyltransferase